MGFEDKLFRGKSILTGEDDKGKNLYNVVHILVGTVLSMLLSLLIFFLSGRNMVMLYASQFLSYAIVGTLIGYWAGCVPSVTLLVIVFATTGKALYRLIAGQAGSYGSPEFFTRLGSWILLAGTIFAFSYFGAKIKGWRTTSSR